MNREILRVGIIGAGVMGSHYARKIHTGVLSHRSAVVAIVDSAPGRAEALAAEVDAAAHASIAAMFDAHELDMVYLAVPDNAHCEPVIECLRRGVPVLVEKPLATTVADAERIVATSRETGVPVEVNFSNRWNPPYVAAKASIEAGEIGEVIGINARLSNAISIPRGMPWASSTTAGWFLFSHIFDLAQWMVGAPATSIMARGSKKKLVAEGIDTYDILQASVQYPAANGLFESAWVLPDSLPSVVDMKFQAIGTEGMIAIDTLDQMVHIASNGRMTYPSVLDWTESRLSSFMDRVDQRRFDDELLRAGLDNTRLLVALHESLVAPTPTVVTVASEERA